MTVMPARMVRKTLRGYGEIFLPSDNALDRSVAREILLGEAYPKVSTSAEIILDIGANMGAAALWFAKLYPDAQLHCFEPSQDIVWECLQENTNRIRSRCQLYNFGLGRVEGDRVMRQTQDSSVTRTCKTPQGEYEELPACQFKMPPPLKGVTIAKIDTEGCEVDILEAFGHDRHSIPVYYIEYHSEADRREIDELLPAHHLVRGTVTARHRGTLVYLHSKVASTEDSLRL